MLFVAADPGFEPGQNESESLVLPLHKSATSTDENYNTRKELFCQVFLVKILKKIFLVILCVLWYNIIHRGNKNHGENSKTHKKAIKRNSGADKARKRLAANRQAFKNSQKGGSDSEPSQARLQASRRTERAFL